MSSPDNLHSLCMCYTTTTSSNYIDFFYLLHSSIFWTLSPFHEHADRLKRNDYIDPIMEERKAFRTIVLSLVYKQIECQNIFSDYFVTNFIKSSEINMYFSLTKYLTRVYNFHDYITSKKEEMPKSREVFLENMEMCLKLKQIVLDYWSNAFHLDDDIVKQHSPQEINNMIRLKMDECLELFKESDQYQNVKNEIIKINEDLKKNKDIIYSNLDLNGREALDRLIEIEMPDNVDDLLSFDETKINNGLFLDEWVINFLKCYLNDGPLGCIGLYTIYTTVDC